MLKKTAEEIAEILDKLYGEGLFGSELATILVETIRRSGYSDPQEIESIRKEVGPIFLELRTIRRAS